MMVNDMKIGNMYSSNPEVAEILSIRREHTRKIVFTNGCFDILHPGHIALLTFARSLAINPIVVVGLNSDDSVRRLKGVGRPVIHGVYRRDQLKALSVVDFVIGFIEDTPELLIQALTPDFLVKGADWSDKKVVGAQYVLAHGGAVVFAPSLGNFSTTRILESPFRKAAELIEAGLRNGAAHHKQYFLEQALRVLYPERKRGDWEPGRAP
jgi:D-beta-D-heptose 7-phosphate kinase/D-beta-D-heptose 1-phosphate adenosyltransferase